MTERNLIVPHDTEDKAWWLLHGVGLENRFVEMCVNRFNLDAAINPAKTTDPYAPDLLVDGKLGDLKTQNTPFFTAGRYRIDPRFAVTFNRKDYERYKKLYPDINIFLWVDWMQTEWKGMKIDYFGGIFRLPFKEIVKMIEAEHSPEHHYTNRIDDKKGNAKSSFILDIRRFEVLFQTEHR